MIFVFYRFLFAPLFLEVILLQCIWARPFCLHSSISVMSDICASSYLNVIYVRNILI